MPPTGGGDAEEPIIQPRLIKRLKERRRLVDFGVREQVPEQAEEQFKERRKPRNVAEGVTNSATRKAAEATQPVFNGVVQAGLEKGNETLFSRL